MLTRLADANDRHSDSPEIDLIKNILLRDMRQAHERRMERIEASIGDLRKEIETRLKTIENKIASLASEAEQSQKQALAELGNAIAGIAERLRLAKQETEHVSE